MVSKWDLNLYAILRGRCRACDKIFYLWRFNSQHKTIAVMWYWIEKREEEAKARSGRKSAQLDKIYWFLTDRNLCCTLKMRKLGRNFVNRRESGHWGIYFNPSCLASHENVMIKNWQEILCRVIALNFA